MATARNDHFSAFAGTYAAFRPTYPAGLFAWLAKVAPAADHAWDCATGTGQAALGLAEHFEHITATDVGTGMIANAAPHPKIHYAVAPAEAVPMLEDASVDLVTVAMALHWFDLPAFWQTCRRVLRPDGVLAYWGYLLPEISPAIDAVVRRYHDETVHAFWPPDRGPLMNGYAAINPPATRLAVPAFTMHAEWSVEQLIGMLDSWSATHRARAATAHDPLAPIVPELRAAWGAPKPRLVTWPLHVHAFRFPTPG